MDELSEIGRKLIDAAMEHDEPPPADESWGTIVSRITTEAPREAAAEAQPRSTPRSWPTWIAVAAIVSAVAVAAWWWGRPDAPAIVEPEPPPITASSPAAASPHKRAPAAPDVEHLVADAEAALAAGDPDRAMALLQRHAELAAIHPQAERRMALRILVLCAQGEQATARGEARAFLAGHPDSQWASDVRSSCAAP